MIQNFRWYSSIKEIAQNRLSHPYLPVFERKRLESLITPITKDSAINLWKYSSWIANFCCIRDQKVIWFNSKWEEFKITKDIILNKDIIMFYE